MQWEFAAVPRTVWSSMWILAMEIQGHLDLMHCQAGLTERSWHFLTVLMNGQHREAGAVPDGCDLFMGVNADAVNTNDEWNSWANRVRLFGRLFHDEVTPPPDTDSYGFAVLLLGGIAAIIHPFCFGQKNHIGFDSPPPLQHQSQKQGIWMALDRIRLLLDWY